MEGRKVNKNNLTKSQYMKFLPLILVIAVVSLIYIFNYLFNTYNPYIIVENEGFMLGNNQLANILNKEDIKNYDNNLNTVDMHEANYIYKMALNRFANKDKEAIDISYPLFINDGLSIVNYNEDTNLINSNLKRTLGGANQVFSYGKAYELNNYDPIDNVSYILLNYSNGIYINLYDLKVKTNTSEYEIPVNSFIYFFDNQINYYERNNDLFTKKQILDIDYNSILSFYYDSLNQEYSYKYEDFLIGVGKIYKEEIIVPPKRIIKEEEQIEEIEEVIEPIVKPEVKPVTPKDWVKPTVISSELDAKVYSANGTITINDPAGVIVKAPSYTFINNGKTYSRKSFYTTGDFTITGLKPDTTFDVVGQYTYLDEDMKTRKIVTFFADTITTKNTESLDPIELSFNMGDIYSRKIELNDLKIVSNINSEVLKGVRSVAFTIDGENYYLSTANVSNLTKGLTLSNVSTSDSLSSNHEYNFEISFFDTVGTKLKVLNSTGTARTSMKAPSVVLKVVSNEVDYVVLGVDLKNDDNVNISNYRYIITNTSGRVIAQDVINGNRIRVNNLDPNQIFIIKVLGDYDLNDGKGLLKDEELTSIEFTSLPITSLGFLNLNFDINDADSDSISLKYNINSNKTDTRLITLVKEINFELYDITNNRVIRTFKASEDELNRLKNLENINLNLDGLSSNTKYTLNIKSLVKQGETTYDLDCLHNLSTVETHKKKPVIDMISSFVTNEMIDFDVRVIDTDSAILSTRVRVELRDSSNKLITSKLIDINSDYERITYKYLTTNTAYFIIFIADEYNETNNNSTFKSRYELSRVERFTENGISGKIELNSAVRVANGENLVDINSETKWIQTARYDTRPKKIDSEGNMHIYSLSGSSTYMYDLSDYHGEYVTATFKIKAIQKFDEKVYFNSYLTGSTSTSYYGILLDNIKTDEWTTYTYSFVVGTNKSGNHFNVNRSKYYGRYYTDFAGFYINKGGSVRAEYVVKDFEIHRSKEKVEVDTSNIEMETGTYNSNGKKDNSYGKRRVRPKDAIILEGGQLYEFYFSDDINYTAYIYFTDMNNKYISARDWFDSGGLVYVPANSKAYVMFRYYSGNVDFEPEDINLRITKYQDRGNITDKRFTYDFVTKARVNLNDLHNEITNNTYYIRVSDKNNHELYVNSYEELADTDTIVNSLKELNLDENREYRVSLFIKIRDREYELDYFNISTDKETVGVASTNDWTYMQPYGNYIILNDLDFEGYTSQVLGWAGKSFHGVIDFQGYSATVHTKTNYRRIGTVDKDGVIKNMVLNVHLDNTVNNNSINGIVGDNNGLFENIIINVYDERPMNFSDLYISTLTYSNTVYGTIRNFIINLKTKVNLCADTGLLARHNYGTIENGYVYGENAYATNALSNVSSRSISLVQRYGGVKSTLQNVFSLSSIEFPNNYSYDLTGLLSYETYGKVQNVYVTGSVSNIKQSVGPIVGYAYATSVFNNAYYLSDYIYTMPNQNKVSAAALADLSFQKNVLRDGFNIDEMVELGYYPHVAFTYDKMPKQDYIELPKIEDRDLVDILNISVISQTNNTAVVEFTIQNEFGDEITGITISNLDSNIISQTYENGKTYLRLEVSNPSVFVSKYEIRSIISKSYNNIRTERKYSPGDKYLFVELYREINNVSDWLKINSYLNQNFAIMSDLDFKEYSNYYINNYSGTMKGNNHVLKNINIISDKNGLFNQMNGTLKDIYFENVTKTSNSTYGGVVGYSNQYGRYDNVHVKDVNIVLPSSRTSNTVYIGGLLGQSYYAKITNSSVTNVSITLTSTISGIRIGGMIGCSSSGTYDNIYANNVNIYVQNTISASGIGGLIGQEDSSVGSIKNAYTTGKIYSNSRNVGGIIGSTSGFVENSYSMVNITSEMGNVAGIAGTANNLSNITNNLFVGNIASKSNTNFHRIIGTGVASSTNSALASGLINGVTSNEINGEKLINMSDLLNSDNYNLGEAYDYSKVNQGIIPKLYYIDTSDLLPNQEDIHFINDIFEIQDIVIDKHVDYSNIVLYLNNPDNYVIDDIIIEDMDIEIKQKAYENGVSIISMEATPLKYFDSYYFKEIKYHVDGSSETLSCEKSLFLEMIFYKNLSTYEDWQNVSKVVAENYILTNDIDFTGLSFNREVVFNRLENASDNESYAIKGMMVTQTSNKADLNIIKKIMTSTAGITFKDITIDYPQTSSNDYVSIISYLYGEVRDVNFENITINAPYKNRIGLFGRSYATLIDNIKADHITVSGRSYVGGIFAYYENKENNLVTNIEANNISVSGTSDYIGGIWSNMGNGFEKIKNIYNISIKDSTITAPNSSYVGGIGGYADASDAIVDNVRVVGKERVGAAFGYGCGYQMENIHVKNSSIEGSVQYVGGLAGYIRTYLYDSSVENTNVTGTGINTQAVGGFLGYHNASTVSRNSVKDSIVNNNGDRTGGFVGLLQNGTISISSVDNVIINGFSNVGGFAGSNRNGTMVNDRVANCTINAQQNYAGGLIGHDNNTVSGTSFYEGAVRNSIVINSNITSASYAGGLIGRLNEEIYNVQNNYGLYTDSTVSTTDNETAHIGVGNNFNNQVVNLARSGFYQNTMINGTPIKNSVIDIVNPNNLIKEVYPGWLNSSTGEYEINYNYPNSTYTDFIEFKAGRTYLLKGENKSKGNTSVFAGRMYNTNHAYIGTIEWSTATFNRLGAYYGLSYMDEALFTPITDFYVRFVFYYELEEISMREITSTYSNLLSKRLFSEDQLRNRLLWNRYMANDSTQEFYNLSHLYYDQSTWNFDTLNHEKTNVVVHDKSGNNHNAVANYTSLVDDGVFMGGVRDKITIDNYTPESKITISVKFTSYISRNYQFLFSYRDPSNGNGVGLFLNSRTIYAMINGSNYSSGFTIPLYKEVTVTMTYENNNILKMYLNGELLYTKTNVGKTIKTSSNAKTYIANDATYTDSYRFMGILSYVNVYNRALSATEVSSNYHQSSGVTDTTGLQLSYDFSELEYDDIGYYPELKAAPYQAHVPLPVKANNNMLTGSPRLTSSKAFSPMFNEKLDNNYHVYSSGIDTINLEFDKISNDLSFTYKIGEKCETINVDRRVYTIKYDYKSDMIITIRNLFESKDINITPNTLSKTISIYNNNYYYIKDNKLYKNDDFIIDNAIHIYKNLVLLSNNSIYNLETGNIQTQLQNNKVIVNTMPLYQSTVEGNIIYTYYNFTEIVDTNNEVTIRDDQLIYKDGHLYVINSSNKDNSSIIVNSYNDNEYQIVLGLDNELYSYKTSLDMNSAFVNANIKEITADFDSSLPVIMIKYNNGEVLVLNYYNGTKIYSNGDNQNISLTSFIGLSLKNNNLSQGNSSYNSNNTLSNTLNTLNDKEITEILDSISSVNNNSNNDTQDAIDKNAVINNNTVNTRYIVSYNEYKDEYEIYDTTDILFGDKPITVNSKINSNKALYNYFYNNTKINDILKDNRIIIYISIIILIIANLVYLVLKSKRKEVVVNE